MAKIKPLLFLLTAPSCCQCVGLKQRIKSWKNNNVRFEELDATENEGKSMAMANNVRSVPTFLLFDKNGVLVGKWNNPQTMEEIDEKIEEGCK